MPLPFRPERRRALLDEAFRLMPLALEDEEAGSRLAALSREYEDGLPRLEFARCPFTGWVQKHTFDPCGLDGLWWNLRAPARPLRERIPTCQAITGAVRIEPPVETFPFLAKPGPGAPFVIPPPARAPAGAGRAQHARLRPPPGLLYRLLRAR